MWFGCGFSRLMWQLLKQWRTLHQEWSWLWQQCVWWRTSNRRKSTILLEPDRRSTQVQKDHGQRFISLDHSWKHFICTNRFLTTGVQARSCWVTWISSKTWGNMTKTTFLWVCFGDQGSEASNTGWCISIMLFCDRLKWWLKSVASTWPTPTLTPAKWRRPHLPLRGFADGSQLWRFMTELPRWADLSLLYLK